MSISNYLEVHFKWDIVKCLRTNAQKHFAINFLKNLFRRSFIALCTIDVMVGEGKKRQCFKRPLISPLFISDLYANCVQKNNEKKLLTCLCPRIISENIQLLDPAYLGTGEWVTVAAPKWQYNWAETFTPYAGTVEFQFSYTQPDRYDASIVTDCGFFNSKWYIPADAHPHFGVGLTVGGE